MSVCATKLLEAASVSPARHDATNSVEYPGLETMQKKPVASTLSRCWEQIPRAIAEHTGSTSQCFVDDNKSIASNKRHWEAKVDVDLQNATTSPLNAKRIRSGIVSFYCPSEDSPPLSASFAGNIRKSKRVKKNMLPRFLIERASPGGEDTAASCDGDGQTQNQRVAHIVETPVSRHVDQSGSEPTLASTGDYPVFRFVTPQETRQINKSWKRPWGPRDMRSQDVTQSTLHESDVHVQKQHTDNTVDQIPWVQMCEQHLLCNPLSYRAHQTPVGHCTTEDVLEIVSQRGVGSTADVYKARLRKACLVHGSLTDKPATTACALQRTRKALHDAQTRAADERPFFLAIKRLHPSEECKYNHVPDDYATIREVGLTMAITQGNKHIVDYYGVSRGACGQLDLWMSFSPCDLSLYTLSPMLSPKEWPASGCKQNSNQLQLKGDNSTVNPCGREILFCDPCVFMNITLDLISAVGHMHRQGMLHRDIKPQNILLGKRRHPSGHTLHTAVLCDMGMAVSDMNDDDGHQGTFRTNRVQTSPYRSPEVWLTDRELMRGYGRPADVYALGMVFLELLAGTSLCYHPQYSAEVRVLWKKKYPDVQPVPSEEGESCDTFDGVTMCETMVRVYDFHRANHARTYVCALHDMGRKVKQELSFSTTSLLYRAITRDGLLTTQFVDRVNLNLTRIFPVNFEYTFTTKNTREGPHVPRVMRGCTVGKGLYALILEMIHPIPEKRPTMAHLTVCSLVKEMAAICGRNPDWSN
jgi:serine/threonine protein kinase